MTSLERRVLSGQAYARSRPWCGEVPVLVAMLATLAAMSAGAAPPTGVSSTLEGCRNNGDITLPNGSGQFVCPDAAYTSGNLGKGWNELDLVPYRITLAAGNSAPATQTYTLAIVVDNRDVGRPGYDVLSVPVLNTALSHASCTAAAAGAPQTLEPGLGGIDASLYRKVTFTQAKNTTCVYDYYARLALGSHLFPGSALHANLANENLGTAGVGARDVSIPVREILPQELRKDMTATQGADHVWNLTKLPSPATVNFGDTCDPNAVSQLPVTIRVEWERLPATPSGAITVITNVYAKNPASRVVTVNVTDVIYSGLVPLDSATSGPVDVPANTELQLLTHSTTVPAGTTDLNDIATATYTDKVTGVPVPGTTSATASATVQSSGAVTNATAVITDEEGVTGAGLSFSADGFTPSVIGSFDAPYVAATPTTGLVGWTSVPQSANGGVEFAKTLYLAGPISTTGALADTATLTGSDGFTATSSASITISSSAHVRLTLEKTIPNILTGTETASFTFEVRDSANSVVASPVLAFAAGETHHSTVVTGLVPGVYTVHELATAPWSAQAPQTVNLTLPTCAGSAAFTNTVSDAFAQVKKVSVPAGSEAGWEFTLSGPGTPAGGEKVVTTGTGYVAFATALQEGSYTITETAQAGWDNLGSSGECSFTVDYPADAGRTFSCTYTNEQQRGRIIVVKQTLPAGSAQSFQFTSTIPGAGSFLLQDTQQNDSGPIAPGSYAVTETPVAGWTLVSATCDDGSLPSTISLQPGETVTCTFVNEQSGGAEVIKTVSGLPPSGTQSFTFQLRLGASPAYPTGEGTVLASGTANAGNGGVIYFGVFLVPGQVYQLCETGLVPGWATSLPSPFVPNSVGNPLVDNSTLCSNFSVAAGETKVFTVDNTPPPGGRAHTIGYWKNWSSCGKSNGSQRPVLDDVLASFSGGGLYVGNLFVNTCFEAVSLLNKSDLSGKKKASDPAFNLAAQLLAARLNVQAGAGQCPASVTAIAQAQALLAAAKFNGTGTYKNLSAANSLAAALDAYNNNDLCP